jgi:catechol 2,3-dioxygenase-like lactoylglutathione lyase family enzyme
MIYDQQPRTNPYCFSCTRPGRVSTFLCAGIWNGEYFRDASSIHVRRPSGHEIMTFVRDSSLAGRTGGVLHFGFRLHAPEDIEVAVHEIEQAGGKILRQGEFAPGFPYLFATDPDGYELEVWYE